MKHVAPITGSNSAIADVFFTGVGSTLQRTDNDIAERVMIDLAEYAVAVLPVHDSFIIHFGYKDMLQQSIENAFEELLGFKPKTALTKRPSVAQPDSEIWMLRFSRLLPVWVKVVEYVGCLAPVRC